MPRLRPGPTQRQANQGDRRPLDVAMTADSGKDTVVGQEPLEELLEAISIGRGRRRRPARAPSRFAVGSSHEPDSFLTEAYSVGCTGNLALFSNTLTCEKPAPHRK